MWSASPPSFVRSSQSFKHNEEMSWHMKYTAEQIEAIAAKLREMPPAEKKKQNHGKQETVKILSKEIYALQKRGYTLDQISETLRGENLSITTPTLKNYLQRAEPAKKARAQAPKDTPPSAPAVKKPADTSKMKALKRILSICRA